MYQYDLHKERVMRKKIIKLAENINLISTEEELRDCTPALFEERDRRESFIEAVNSVDYYDVNIDIITAVFCSFADFYNSSRSFKDFYCDIYHMLNMILNNN